MAAAYRLTLELAGEHLMKIDLDEPDEVVGGLTAIVETVVEQAVAFDNDPSVILAALDDLRAYVNNVFDKGRI